jgi:hypothetical protein
VSSAILYLAIVGIWAFLLVPRWLRRSHLLTLTGMDTAGHDGMLAGDSVPGDSVPGENEASETAAGTGAEAVGGDGPWGAEVSYTAIAYQQVSKDDTPEPDTAPIAPVVVSLDGEPVPADVADDELVSPAQPGRPARPPISRSKILQARRRLLTILVLLAASAVTCTMLKLTSPWVCVPPAAMLGMYLLLLREAAIADAEVATYRADQAALARRRAATEAALAPQPTAEIIDISDRLNDQLYDQYADATVRAVGD